MTDNMTRSRLFQVYVLQKQTQEIEIAHCSLSLDLSLSTLHLCYLDHGLD